MTIDTRDYDLKLDKEKQKDLDRELLWGELSTPDKASDFIYRHDLTWTLGGFILHEIAKTKSEIDAWKHPCSQGTKAASFDKMCDALTKYINEFVEEKHD
jgi:hypothetical protein